MRHEKTNQRKHIPNQIGLYTQGIIVLSTEIERYRNREA